MQTPAAVQPLLEVLNPPPYTPGRPWTPPASDEVKIAVVESLSKLKAEQAVEPLKSLVLNPMTSSKLADAAAAALKAMGQKPPARPKPPPPPAPKPAKEDTSAGADKPGKAERGSEGKP
jgi:HEAT repeat protein